MEEVDVTNDSIVGVNGSDIVILRARPRLSRAEALRLAAWIVALTDKDEFDRVYEAVSNT